MIEAPLARCVPRSPQCVNPALFNVPPKVTIRDRVRKARTLKAMKQSTSHPWRTPLSDLGGNSGRGPPKCYVMPPMRYARPPKSGVKPPKSFEGFAIHLIANAIFDDELRTKE